MCFRLHPLWEVEPTTLTVNDWFRWSNPVWEMAHIQLQGAVPNQKKVAGCTCQLTAPFNKVTMAVCSPRTSDFVSLHLSPGITTPIQTPQLSNLPLEAACSILNLPNISCLHAGTSPLSSHCPPKVPAESPLQPNSSGRLNHSVLSLQNSRWRRNPQQYFTDWEEYGLRWVQERSWTLPS